ncbi:quinolinate synthase [Paenibacillus sp. 481]|uniref:quinolinate synthase n=1 Tax=Paenibacillus sp. 481 TaxID=2835869 RepID=UPI001E3F6A79|nr:quinolinate synthase [Paenibacillus sp. 481]UHA73001.1 quinolinate synthase [Paenibacillus sp. 481]
MAKIRPIPTVTIMALAGAVLFGGWHLYETKMVEQPLAEAIQEHKLAKQVQVDLQQKSVVVKLEAKPEANVRELVQAAYKEADKRAKGRSIRVEMINEQSTPRLEQIWSKAIFGVAEAMVHQKYSDIPKQLTALTQQTTVNVETEMDERFVYVTLKDGKGIKTVLLPLQGEKMGVWPNEQAKLVTLD